MRFKKRIENPPNKDNEALLLRNKLSELRSCIADKINLSEDFNDCSTISILYVDDEKNNLLSFKAHFRKEFNVVTSLSAEGGLKEMEKHKFHIVISDQRMPNMEGDKFLQIVKEKYPKAVRMITTGHADREAIINSINNANIFKHITKPWNIGELKDYIMDAYEKYLKHSSYYTIEQAS